MAFNYTECIRGNFTARRSCRDQCTLDTCPLNLSFWDYRPSIPANALFLALFALSTILFLVQGAWSRRFLGFTVAMLSGCILEVLGYAGRLWAYSQPFVEVRTTTNSFFPSFGYDLGGKDVTIFGTAPQSNITSIKTNQPFLFVQNAFLIQIICLTIGPAFLAAGIYFCLSRIVLTFGAENSRIKPLSYPRIFIPCDFFSLVLQATGGGMASAATHSNRSPTAGNNIMIAGLAFQVATLFVFILLSLDFAWRTWTRMRSLGATEALDQKHAALRRSFKFQAFLVALSFATLCIFTRSVYRVAELSQGWQGHLIKTQKYFIGLEGAIVSAGVLALNFFHPGFCFQEGYTEERGAFGFGRKKKVEKVEQSGVTTPDTEAVKQ